VSRDDPPTSCREQPTLLLSALSLLTRARKDTTRCTKAITIRGDQHICNTSAISAAWPWRPGAAKLGNGLMPNKVLFYMRAETDRALIEKKQFI
jgi:hypothetical protein